MDPRNECCRSNWRVASGVSAWNCLLSAANYIAAAAAAAAAVLVPLLVVGASCCGAGAVVAVAAGGLLMVTPCFDEAGLFISVQQL